MEAEVISMSGSFGGCVLNDTEWAMGIVYDSHPTLAKAWSASACLPKAGVNEGVLKSLDFMNKNLWKT